MRSCRRLLSFAGVSLATVSVIQSTQLCLCDEKMGHNREFPELKRFRSRVLIGGAPALNFQGVPAVLHVSHALVILCYLCGRPAVSYLPNTAVSSKIHHSECLLQASGGAWRLDLGLPRQEKATKGQETSF